MDNGTFELIEQIRGDLADVAALARKPEGLERATRKAIREMAADVQGWAGRNIEPDTRLPGE